MEGALIHLGWLVEAADFPYELQGGGADLFLGDRWFKIE
jgi:hypothetical protein